MQPISRLFRTLRPLDPSPALLGRILASVHAAALAYARRLFWGAISVATISVAGLFITVRMLASQASTSGFFQYLSLATSDTSAALAHWQDYGYSLIESLPILAMVMTLTAVVVLLIAIRQVAAASTLRSAHISH